MNSQFVRSAQIALLLSGSMLASCSPAERPFRLVQLCLADSQEIVSFEDSMRLIAKENAMSFTDGSRQTEADLAELGRGNPNVNVPHPTLNIGAERGDRFSFGAENFGEAPSQVVVGFNGRDREAAEKFSNAVVRRLGTRWKVHEVLPQGSGAFPLRSCA